MKIMFLCTGNSARSQMAEGLARHIAGSRWEVHSAGIEPKGVNPHSVAAMKEAGIDISGQTSKPIDQDLLAKMDLIVTLCGDARDRCPITPPSVKHLHWPLPDPAAVEGTEEEIMASFRSVRDEIRERIMRLLEEQGGCVMTENVDHLYVVWTSPDRDVALKMAFMYTNNSKVKGWWKDVTLVVWGPSANLLAHDIELQAKVKAMKDAGVNLLACKACSDSYGVSEVLESLGIQVIYMGVPLTEALKQGLKVLTV